MSERQDDGNNEFNENEEVEAEISSATATNTSQTESQTENEEGQEEEEEKSSSSRRTRTKGFSDNLQDQHEQSQLKQRKQISIGSSNISTSGGSKSEPEEDHQHNSNSEVQASLSKSYKNNNNCTKDENEIEEEDSNLLTNSLKEEDKSFPTANNNKRVKNSKAESTSPHNHPHQDQEPQNIADDDDGDHTQANGKKTSSKRQINESVVDGSVKRNNDENDDDDNVNAEDDYYDEGGDEEEDDNNEDDSEENLNSNANSNLSRGESTSKSRDNSFSPTEHKSTNEIKSVKSSANNTNLTNNTNTTASATDEDNFNVCSPGRESSPVSPTENIKLSPSMASKHRGGIGSTTPNKISNRLSVTISGSPFESGVNTECIQLLRQIWSVHEEAVVFLGKIRRALSFFRQELRSQENEFESSFREKRLSTASFSSNPGTRKMKFGVNVDVPGLISGVGGGGSGVQFDEDSERNSESWIPLQIFIDGLKCISDNFSDIEKQYVTLSVFQSQCKLTLFAKVKHAKQQVAHDRLSIMHGIQQLLNVTLYLLSTPYFWAHSEDERTSQLVQNVFQLTEIYNWCLESSWSRPMDAAIATSTTSLPSPTSELDPSGVSTDAANSAAGTSAAASDPKKASKSDLPNRLRILVQINAACRNDTPLLRLSLKPLSATRLLQIVAQRRSSFAAHAFSRVTLSSFYAEPIGILSVDKFEPCFTDEDSRLSPLGKGFSQYPSLLGRAAVKKSENGNQKLSRSARTKMYSYFHEVLWTLAGEHSEDLLLWGLHSNIIPLVLQPLDTFIALRNALMLGQHFQESNLSPMLSAFDSVSGALHSFSLMANWDEKMREAFEETAKVKRPEQIIIARNPEPSEWATEIGSKFGQIITSCISLIEGGDGISNMMRSTAMRLSPNEEEALGDEAQTLFRLEATLVYFKAWIVKRAKVWLNAWATPQFLACSQRESVLLVRLIKSRESFLITREILLKSGNISIRLTAKNRQACADDLRTALLQLQSMPDELLQAVGPVCCTLSLATLQSYMPASNHWRGVGRSSGLDPDRPSSYVKIFIDRVIEPVMTAAVELVPGPIQEAMGKQAVHAACDAWLQYILQRKIKFSEWGAMQLLRDFTAFRDWIRTETGLEKEAGRAILQLEVLKRCEGVAYLLLRNPGDILGVGKPARKTRRVAPSSSDSVDSSPSMADSTAEDDIPPEMYVPNQQMWLELRLRRGVFSSPCCS